MSKSILLASAGLVFAGLCSTAHAQTAESAKVTEVSAESVELASTERADGEIIVTAQRRSESVLRVPVSVTVVGAEALQDNGINDLSALTKLAPSLQSGNDDSFSVRGIGTNTFAPTVESTVSQVLDEVVLGSPTFAANAFYDIERIEVLNGPQGLLFGKNASAGLINITTVRPRLGEYDMSFDAEATSRFRPGDDGEGVRVRTTLNIPVGDTVAVRASGTYTVQDAITRNVGNPIGRNEPDLSQYGGRLKILAEPSSALAIYLIGDYFKSSGVSGFADATYRSLGPNSQYPTILAAAGVTPGPENLTVATDGPAFRDVELGGVQANLSYLFGNGMELSSITAWKAFDQQFQFDADQTPVNFFNTNLNATKYDQFSQEVRLALPAENPLTGQFGLYYFRANTTNDVLRGGLNGLPSFVAVRFPFCVNATVTPGPPPACSRSNRFFLGQDSHLANNVKSYAAFGQVSYTPVEKLKLTAGGRITRDEASIELAENVGNYFVTLGVPNNFTTDRASNTNFSWKLGADYQVTPDTLLYAFYGHGYKGPGFSNASPARGANLAVDPEISKGGEVGVKSALFDRRLTVSAAVFHTRFTNLQVQAFDVLLQTIVLGNAATATTKGIDLSLQARPVRGLTLSASASLIDAKFNSYPGAKCYTTQPGCAVGGVFDAAGLPVPLSAKFTSTVSADYEFPLGEHVDALTNLTYYHRSPLNSGFAPSMTIPTWDRIDANLGVRMENVSVSLFCKNCFNQIRPFSTSEEPGDAVNRGTLSLVQRFNYDSVRTIGVRLGFNF